MNIEYSGFVKNGTLSDNTGHAKIEYQNNNTKLTAQGIIEDGILV